jgi:hypothetical protein
MTRRNVWWFCLSLFLVLSAAARTPQNQTDHSDREKLIGAWHLVKIEAPGTDGKAAAEPQPTGMLIYTKDGHMSVQLMYRERVSRMNTSTGDMRRPLAVTIWMSFATC